MPPVLIGIGLGAAVGGLTVGTVTAAVVGAAIGGAVMAAATLLSPKQQSPTYTNDQAQSTASTIYPVPYVFGSVGVGGNIIQCTKANQTYRELVYGLGEGPLNNYRRARYNKKDFDAVGESQTLPVTDFKQGLATEILPSVAVFPLLYHQGKPQAYRNTGTLWMRIRGKSFTQSGQNLLITLEGMQCWTLADTSARAFSRNPAVIAATYLKDCKRLDWSAIDVATFQLLEAYCDAYFSETAEISENLMGAGALTASNRRTMNNPVSHLLHDNGERYSSNTTDVYVIYDFGECCEKRVCRYQIKAESQHTEYRPSAWTFEGSNDNSNWTVLDTRSGITWGTLTQDFDIASGSIGRYRYYRWHFTAGATDHYNIERVKMYGFLGATCKRHVLDYAFDTFQADTDIEKIVGQAFHGKLIKSQGKWKPVWMHAGSSVFSFTKANIEKESFSSGEDEIPNLVRITFRDRTRDFGQETIEVRDHADIEARGEIVYEERCDFLTDRESAMRRGQMLFEFKRLCPGYIKLKCGQYASKLEEYDIVDVSHPRAIEDGKLYFVEEIKEDGRGCRSFTLREYNGSIFDGRLPGFQTHETDPDSGAANDTPGAVVVSSASAVPIASGNGAALQWAASEYAHVVSYLISHRCRDAAGALAWSDWTEAAESEGCTFVYKLTASEIALYGSDAQIEFIIQAKDKYGNISEESDSISVSLSLAIAQVKVFLGDGSTALFTLGSGYAAGSTDISIDGLRIDRKIVGINDGTDGSPDSYEYEEIDPAGGDIAFPKFAPPVGAVLSVHYLLA